MLNQLLSALLVMVVNSTVIAQECIQVIDADDGTPVRQCEVRDEDGSLLAITASDGLFCLSPPLPDALFLLAEGYHPASVDAAALSTGQVRMRPLVVELPEVRIVPEADMRLGLAVMTTTSVDSSLLHGFERSGLRSAMLWVPGVQMDMRGHGGSMRLSIRGSLLRSPFGVRGVKVYWGAFPLTLADGSTPLELLDPELVGDLQVVRSLGSPAHGSAPAGLLLAEAPGRIDNGAHWQLQLTGGSNGFHRATARVDLAHEGASLTVGAVHQRNDGYRDQEWSRRDQIFLSSRWVQGNTLIRTQLTMQQVAWGLPGSLDSLTAATRPRSARPYSELIDARLEKRQFMAGIAMDHALGRGTSITTAVHAQLIDKLNPYGTFPGFSGYKEEDIAAMGTRIALHHARHLGPWRMDASIGVEVLGQRDRLDERVFVEALPDSFRTRVDTRVVNANGFAELRLRHTAGTDLFLSVGSERTAHVHGDLLRDSEVSYTRPVVFYPVLGIAQRLGAQWQAALRFGDAVSRPTVWELLGTIGRFDPELRPELVREWEISLQRAPREPGLHFSVAAYTRTTEGLILPRITSDGTGEVFVNAGRAEQRGVEAMAEMPIARMGGSALFGMATLTVQDHRLLRPGTTDIAIPGVPGAMSGAILRYRHARGAGLELGLRHMAPVPVDVMATAELPAHVVAHVRASWLFQVGRDRRLAAFVHVENLGDARYSAFVQMTDPGGRYHNPAPGRSLFVGLSYMPVGKKS